MKLNQIKFFRNVFTEVIILSFLTLLIFPPLVAFLLRILVHNEPPLSQIVMSIVIWSPIIVFWCIYPKMRIIYVNLFDVFETEKLTFIKTFNLAIKRTFCKHGSTEAIIEENPSPLHFLDIKAKCSDCGFTSFEIYEKWHKRHKLQLADDVLFQRNIEKFPEFYKNQIHSMNIKVEEEI